MGKVILITGVSSGFGKASATALAKAGHHVYGTVRKGETGIDNVSILKMDLNDVQSLKNAVSAIIEKEGKLDVLINNAGMHIGGPVETTPMEFIRLQIDTNISGTLLVTREVLPHMRRAASGTIINISSIGGLMGLPFQGIYSAAKFAMEGFSEALRMEVRQFGIKIVVINPGDFCTNNTSNRRGFLAPTGDNDPYRETYGNGLSAIEADEAKGWDPKVLAKKIVKIVNSKNPRQRYIIASSEQKLAVVLKYILPGKIFRAILEGHYKLR